MEIAQKNATIKVILFTSKTLSNGEHPLMVRIYKDGQRKYFSLGISSSIDFWDLEKDKPKTKHPKKLEILTRIHSIEKEFLDKITEFKFSGKKYDIDYLINSVVKKTQGNNLSTFIDDIVLSLKNENRLKNAEIYNDCKQAIFRFHPNEKLSFHDIDYTFLSNWESFMRQKLYKETSMSVYMRTLRSIYNRAIKAEIVPISSYPFKTYTISHFNTETRKRAISKENILKILNYPSKKGTKLRDCLNIFTYSYLNQGMNFIDIAHLKWKSISSENVMEYTRKKTGKDFAIKQDERSLSILDEYRNITGYNIENYVFPILDINFHTDAVKIQNRIKKVSRQLNKNLRKIGEELGIDKRITSYVARHTYATVLKKSGVSVSIISEAMGHESESITKVYLEGFESEVIFEANKNLV